MPFSEAEKRDIFEIFVKNSYNKRKARLEYVYEGQRNIPSLNTFRNVHKQVTESLSFSRKKQIINRDENYYNDELNIVLYFQGNFIFVFCSFILSYFSDFQKIQAHPYPWQHEIWKKLITKYKILCLNISSIHTKYYLSSI